MSIDLFREFAMLATFRNFTSAAKSLNISQPTLSRHIASLEMELGVKLLFKEKPFCLTSAGEAVFRRASELVSIYDEVVEELQPLRNVEPERIVIQDMRHLSSLFARIDIAEQTMRETHPELSFMVMDPKSGDTPAEMLDSGIDLSFTFRIRKELIDTLDIDDCYGYIHIPEFPAKLGFGVRKGHPLEGQENASILDFANEKFLSPAQYSHEDFRSEFIAVCRGVGFTPRFELVQTNNLIELYAKGAESGVYIITEAEEGAPKFAKVNSSAKLSVVRLIEEYRVSAFLLYRKDRLTPAFRDFIEAIVTAF